MPMRTSRTASPSRSNRGRPSLSLTDGGPPVAAAADGTLLRGVEGAAEGVPTVNVDDLPASRASSRATPGPGADRRSGSGAAASADRRTFRMQDPAIEVTWRAASRSTFGDASQAEEKWAAVAAILANPKVKTLTHLDVRVPERPAIGGAAPPLKERVRPKRRIAKRDRARSRQPSSHSLRVRRRRREPSSPPRGLGGCRIPCRCLPAH